MKESLLQYLPQIDRILCKINAKNDRRSARPLQEWRTWVRSRSEALWAGTGRGASSRRAESRGGRVRSVRGAAAFRSGSGGLRRMDRRDSIHSVHDRCIYGFGPVGTVPPHARAKAAVQRSARRESSGGVERPAAVPAGGSSTGGLPGMPRRTCPAGRLGAPVRRTPGGRSLGQLPFRVLGSTAVENTAATPNETPAPQWLPSLETWRHGCLWTGRPLVARHGPSCETPLDSQACARSGSPVEANSA